METPKMTPDSTRSVQEMLREAGEIENAMTQIMIHHSETAEERTKAIADHPKLSKLSEEEIAELEDEILEQIEDGEMMRVSDQTDAGQGHLG